MLSHLIDVSIRAALLALVAAAALWAARGRRTAAMEHALWTAVAGGMLGLLLFGSALPRLRVQVLRTEVVHVTQPFEVIQPAIGGTSAKPAAAAPETPQLKVDWFEFGYAAIALVFLARFALGMFLVQRLIAKSVPFSSFRESSRISVPLTVGWFRPVILLPIDWREWDRAKLDAVLAHESAHATRRDGLIGATAGLNRCLFWFHPLAWWLERRLAFLAELACDEACVAATGDREAYARLLVEMARVVDGPHGRLRGHALTMAAGSHIRQRVESIFKEGRTFSLGLSPAGRAAVALCAMPMIWGAGAVTLDRRVLPQLETKVRFEVASIRPSVPTPSEPVAGGRGGGAAGGSCIDRFTVDAGRVDIGCVSLGALISLAFGVPSNRVIGPDWIAGRGTPRFDIAAKLPDGAPKNQVPEMLQALLADRFKLAIHRGSKDETVYAMAVAKGGLKLKEAAASIAARGDDPDASGMLIQLDGIQTRRSPLPNADGVTTLDNPRIGTARQVLDFEHGTSRREAPSTTLQGFADLLGFGMGQTIVDATGLTGRYQVVLELLSVHAAVAAAEAAQADGTSIADAVRAVQLSSVRDALSKLGLTLEPRKGSVDTIVVDHVEKAPTDN